MTDQSFQGPHPRVTNRHECACAGRLLEFFHEHGEHRAVKLLGLRDAHAVDFEANNIKTGAREEVDDNDQVDEPSQHRKEGRDRHPDAVEGSGLEPKELSDQLPSARPPQVGTPGYRPP